MDRTRLAHLIGEIEKTERQRRFRQAGIAVLTGSLVLAVMLVLTPHDTHPSAPVATIATTTPSTAAFSHVKITAQAAIVYDLTTGETLFERNPDAQLPLASITKLLTIYAATDSMGNKTPVTISPSAVATEGDSGLTAGEQFAFNDLARLALVASSNDAAEAIAEASENRRSMNVSSLLASAASAVGLSQTYAVNGTGLDVNTKLSGGYGSAHDVALLAGALLAKAPAIAHATIAPTVTIKSLAGVTHTLMNTNQDVVHIPGIEMSKTGYTDLAGGNLVVVFDAGINHPVAVVVLGSTYEGRFSDVDSLVAATLNAFAGVPASNSR